MINQRARSPDSNAMAASLVLAVVASFVLILISVHAFQLITAALRRLPPGPLPLPVIGNLLDIGRGSPNRSLARLADRYGALMSVRLGVVHAVVVSSTDAAREVLQRHNADLADRPVIDAWHANGHRDNSIIAGPPHARWRALRKLCSTELFAPARMNALRPMRQQKVRELVRYVSEKAECGEAIAVRDQVFTAAMNILSGSLFSVDLDRPSFRGFKDTIKEATILAAKPNLSDFFPVLAAADLQGLRRRMVPLVAHAHQILDELFAQRLRSREACEPPKNDMLDVVLDKEHEWQQQGSEIDRYAIKGMFTDMYVAGSDTSSTAIEWAMAALLRHPEVMKKVKGELTRVLGTKTEVEESDIGQLPYLQAVVKEVLRLYPPVAMSFYRAEASVQMKGYTIPQGTTVILNIWAVHRDAHVWDDPNDFVPERFLEGDMDFSGKDCKLIPFGGGRRICIGLPLAYRTVHLILASLLHQFDWMVPEEAAMEENGIDMTEEFGIVVSMATPLKAIAKKCDL